MCDSCKNILGSCVKAHESKFCPLKKASYCTFCSIYGHTSVKCTRDRTYRNVEVETEYEYEATKSYYLDYVDEPKAIRALLKAHGELPKKEERDKDKYKKQLIKLAKKRNWILVPHVLQKHKTTV